MSLRLYPGITTSHIPNRAIEDALRVIDTFLRDIGPAFKNLEEDVSGSVSGGGGGIAGASYLTVTNEAALSAERALVVTAPITKSDGGANSSLTLGLTFAAPTATFGDTAALGVAASLVRSDCRFVYPEALKSLLGSLSKITLTDNGVDQTLTASLGVLHLVPGTGIDIDFPASTAASLIIKPNATTAAGNIVSVQGRPVAGSRTLMAPNWFSPGASDVFSGQTFRCWDAQFSSFLGQITNCVFVGHDVSVMTISPSSGSGSGNKAYGFRNVNLSIGGTGNGSWAEVASAFFAGPDRGALTSFKSDVLATIILEPPTGCNKKQDGTTDVDQVGILIRQRAAEGTAPTNRIGLEIEAQNTGTNRFSGRFFNTLRLTNPSGIAQSALELRQLNTGATAGAHVNFDDKAGDPSSPVTGDLWRNGAALNYRKDGTTTVDLALGAGDNISVNGTAATDANFHDTNPAAPTGGDSGWNGLDIRWQIDTTTTPDQISGYLGKDLNGNWIIGFTPTPSAVNYLGIRNAITGASPLLAAVGTDTNINLALSPKGTGAVFIGDASAGAPAAFIEQSDPAAPASNTCLVYAKDNGAGKTQFVVRFPTGAVQVLATEP